MIAGYYGLGNIGDEAILSGIINSLNHAFNEDIQISVITNDPTGTYNLHKIGTIPQSFKQGIPLFLKNQIFRGESYKIAQEIKDCDIFILGGGELLQDLKWYYLPVLLSLVYFAQKNGRRTVIYGIGAGPIETTLGKQLCKKILNNVDVLTVRDLKSKESLENSGVNNVIQTADPAFAIDIPESQELDRLFLSTNISSIKNLIGVTAHSRIYNDELFRKNDGAFIDLPSRRRKFASLFDEILLNEDKNLVLMPTVKADIDGFLDVKNYSKNDTNIYLLNHSTDFRLFLSCLKKIDILIGMKLHSLIFATLLGIPFVPLSYSSKVKAYLDILNLNNLNIDIEDIEKSCFNEHVIKSLQMVTHQKLNLSQKLLEQSKYLRNAAFDNAQYVKELDT